MGRPRRYGKSPISDALRALHELNALGHCLRHLMIARTEAPDHGQVSIAVHKSSPMHPQALCLQCGSLNVLRPSAASHSAETPSQTPRKVIKRVTLSCDPMGRLVISESAPIDPQAWDALKRRPRSPK